MFKSRPQPADLLSQILMKPPNNSRHLMSANCPIEVIRHQHLQIKSRPCCHLHQATKHALFQRPPGTCPIPIFTPPYIISIPQRIFQYCQVELRLQIHSSRRVFPAADLIGFLTAATSNPHIALDLLLWVCSLKLRGLYCPGFVLADCVWKHTGFY
jgi:hypothetical protein